MAQPFRLHLLIVDDDADVLESLHVSLQLHGVSSEGVGSAAAARTALATGRDRFDVVLLDIDMPGGSGLDLLHEMRRTGVETPVIFLTGFEDVEHKVRGLRLGADDYIVKPFASAELLARVEAVVRRQQSLPTLAVGDLTLDLSSRVVSLAGRRVELSPKEFELLRVLMEARGRAVSRRDLLRQVWGIAHEPETSVVEVLVNRLRRKLDPDGSSPLETVTGEGYRIASAGRAFPDNGSSRDTETGTSESE